MSDGFVSGIDAGWGNREQVSETLSILRIAIHLLSGYHVEE
jgi:hypothetical protein